MKKIIQVFTLLSFLSFSGVATAATEPTNETAKAMDYFKRIFQACEKEDKNTFWSQFSSRATPPEEQRDGLFDFYCTGITSKSLKQLEIYDFYVKAKATDGDDSKKTVLCKALKGTGSSSCDNLFDVVIENGQIKRDM